MSNAIKKLSIVAANETAKQTPAKKPAAKKTAAPAKWDDALVNRIIENTVAVARVEELRKTLDMDITKFRTYKVKLGASRRTCAVSQQFFAGFIAQGVNEKTAANYLSCLRAAINDGKAFSLNQSRDNAKGKKAGTRKAKAGSTWKDTGEVLEALAIAIHNVKDKAGAALWEKALAMAPDGFDFAIADFLESQGETTE